MFRKMRRNKQQLDEKECEQLLEKATSGVLALKGDDGYPYAVPISYIYSDKKLYFHSARTGHKIDAIANNPKASFCIIDEDKIVPEELTTYFRSVIAFGKVRILKDEIQILSTIRALAKKYSTDMTEKTEAEIQKSLGHFYMIEFEIEHMTGKEAIEFVRMKEPR